MGSSRLIILFVVIIAYMASNAYAGRFKQRPARPASAGASSFASSSASSSSSGDSGGYKQPAQRLSSPQECARTCSAGTPPKTCHYTFVVEHYATLTNACTLCRSNATTRLVDDCQCIEADGYEISGIITVNRMYPGPAIVVCENDLVVVDVVNHVAGAGITIHWHGITQRNTPYYDGVPYVTQCPISDGSTFRYQWKANNAGTHFYHAHSGLHKAVGLEGPIIVREAKYDEPNNQLWNVENIQHMIFITDWLHAAVEEHLPGTVRRNPGQLPDNFLINGRGRWTDPVTGNTTTTPRSVFTVKSGDSNRFRMVNSCSFVCPVTMTIEGHNLTVFSSDGEPFDPVTVTSITSSSAERYDFVLKADKPVGDYWIQVRAVGACTGRQMQQLAILRYESKGGPVQSNPREPTYSVGLPRGVVLNELNVRCDNLTNVTDVVCVTQLKSIEPVPQPLLKKVPDIKIYMPFGFYTWTDAVFTPGTYKHFLVTGGRQFSSLVSNISNVFPPSALISQRDDNPPGTICDPNNLPPGCGDFGPCSCAHVQEIPLNAVVELVLVDEAQIPGLSHPFHLHGAAFHVLGEGCGDDYNISSINVDIAKDMDRRGLLKRHTKRPPAKDTFALPNNGFSIVRFFANNPGYWLFHCHFLPHLSDGMSMFFHVGTPEDLPPVPKGFPTCGNFISEIGPNWW